MNLEEIIKSRDASKLNKYLSANKIKVPEHRRIMKLISKTNWDIAEFKGYSDTLDWYYFNISLLREENFVSSMEFIDNNLDYFTSWYRADGTLNFLKKKNMGFELLYFYSNKYIKDKREFVIRFGYLLFFLLKMDDIEIGKIEKLLMDSDFYYVQMVEAWLICEMVVRNNKAGFQVLKRSKLKYSILGKAIQKCLDSFRIDDKLKLEIKKLRKEKKDN